MANSIGAETPWVVDFHSHTLPEAYVEELLRLAEHDPGLEPAAQMVVEQVPGRMPAACGRNLLGGADIRVRELEASGVHMQVLSAASMLSYPASAQHRPELVRTWNDSTQQWAADHPERFMVFASVPLPDVPASIKEVERLGDTQGVTGFCTTTHVLGEPIDSDEWAPLYSQWNEMGAVVFVHPHRFCVPNIMPRWMEMDVGTQFDDTLAAIRLYSSGLTSRYPRIRWLLSHLGGTLPFVLGRLDEHWERDRVHRVHATAPSQSLDGLFFDTAGHDEASTRFALEVLGGERFVFGSDFPMVGADSLKLAVDRVARAVEGAGVDREALSRNAWALMTRTDADAGSQRRKGSEL